ncbi:MAE_28990/MAE_18760 family HEPN-like nuclease [Maribellus sp. YY47]|uniref:MAE_28990/MAE_18760 family HEPN-like nuclease n=1 Tax=Maribellus sp. YY47 TaxID=2929486 RepID=UPI00200161F8|nr:MAE_28990/MAE_18760 family HEPN-like nuclease [Maribellus sp. YY47]MCK3684616.1 MAE_28990/MAE_18760 family HEPN-like nuclease [Maribellus sp. YY47]
MGNNFQQEIMADINWRYSELSILRTLPFKYGISEEHRKFLIRYSVPIIYSLWEGFIKTSFECYVRVLNQMNLNISQINYNLLAHAIDSADKLTLQNQRVQFKTKVEFVDSLMQFMQSNVIISSQIPTTSNVNFEVLNKILERFNLTPIPVKDFKNNINKLLRFRNSVSHGDNSIPVTSTDIEKFCTLLNDLMYEVYDRIEKGYKNKTYLK